MEGNSTSRRGPRDRRAFAGVILLRAFVAFALGASVLLGDKTKPALANFIALYWLVGSVLTFDGRFQIDDGLPAIAPGSPRSWGC